MFSIIACIGKGRELGKKNDLVFHFKEDMRFFRETTRGRTVVMGYNTWLSIGAKPLPKRKNLVISPKKIESLPEGVEQIYDFESYASENRDTDEEIFVIGGAKTYSDFLPYTNIMYLTEVDANVSDSDVFFPEFNPKEFNKTEIAHSEDNGIKFTFYKYTRKA